MKKTILSILLISLSFNAFSNETKNNEKLEICNLFEKFAGNIMDIRQSGALTAYELTKSYNSIETKYLSDYVSETIIAAYSQSRFDSPEIKEKVIKNFSNKAFIECMKQDFEF